MKGANMFPFLIVLLIFLYRRNSQDTGKINAFCSLEVVYKLGYRTPTIFFLQMFMIVFYNGKVLFMR